MSETIKTYKTKAGFQIEVEVWLNDSEVIIRLELWSPAACYDLYRKTIKSKHLTDAWIEIRDAETDMKMLITELDCECDVDTIIESCRTTRNGRDVDEYGDSEHYRMMTNCINYLLTKQNNNVRNNT